MLNTTCEKDSNEINIMNLPEREFKIKIINMLMEVQKNIQELRNEFKSRLDVVEEMVNGIEIREEEYKEAEAQREKRNL